MLKKSILTIVALTFFLSCKWNDEEQNKKNDTITNAKDVVIGGDKDKDGCLASAGYTWSKLNKECVRVFSGIQLLPADKIKASEDEAVLAAYLLFDESATNAEVFLPNEEESILLKRESEGKPWVNGDWQLIPYKGFVLKKAGKLLFVGDGEIGNRVSGSDDSEDVAP